MLNYILRSSLCLTAVYLVQCLRSQTSLLSTPEFVLSSYRFFFYCCLSNSTFERKKRAFFSNSSSHFLFLCALSLLHFWKDFRFLRSDNSLIHFHLEGFFRIEWKWKQVFRLWSLPQAVNHWLRLELAAENEAEIYARIRNLENRDFYNLPPQNQPGESTKDLFASTSIKLSMFHILEKS